MLSASGSRQGAGLKPASPTESPTPSPSSTSSGAAKATAAAALKEMVRPLDQSDTADVSVAVDDLTTGVQAAYDGERKNVTASIVKVDILATLLYQNRDNGSTLSPSQQQVATSMIENSDNDSATALWNDAGGSSGVNAANRAFGLSGTAAGSDWGLTETTADDQVQLLRQVLTGHSVLSPTARRYEGGLMSKVESDQQWGVPAAADPGTPSEVKNGWLPHPSPAWVINSDGEITSHGQRMLVSVLSDDNQSEASGIALVQRTAKQATAAVSTARG